MKLNLDELKKVAEAATPGPWNMWAGWGNWSKRVQITEGDAVQNTFGDHICELESLLQIMLDPENAPPQYSLENAWQKFCELRKS